MNFIEEITDWINTKKRLIGSVDFLNDFASVDDTLGNDDKILILAMGNSQIRITKENIEIAHGIYSYTGINISKDKIYLKLQNGKTIDLEDVHRLLDYTFREQPSFLEQLSSVLPVTYNDVTGQIGILTANSGQSGALSSSDWSSFNSKQAGSVELTGLSALTSNGALFRTAVGTYTGRAIVPSDISGLGTISTQNASSVTLTGGSINGVTIGATSPSPAQFSRLTSTAQNTVDVPLTLNVVSSGADTLQVIRSDTTVGFKILNSGSLEVGTGSNYRHSGNAVVGSRKTGWTAATGTATRSTFATSTVSTQILAEHVKALIDDLISHGLIGT